MLLFTKTLHGSKSLWRCNDVRKFDADAILFREIQSKKRDFLNVYGTFSMWFRLESGKICKNNDHTCLFHCINTCQVPRTMFELLSQDPANVNA